MSVKHGDKCSQEGMWSRTRPATLHPYASKCELSCSIGSQMIKSSQTGMLSDNSLMSRGIGSMFPTEPVNDSSAGIPLSVSHGDKCSQEGMRTCTRPAQLTSVC